MRGSYLPPTYLTFPILVTISNDSLGCSSTAQKKGYPMTALHLQRLSWLILERLKLCLCEIVWVDHWVDQNSALTSTVLCEILSIASIKWRVGVYIERLTLSASTIFQLHHMLKHCNWSVVVRFDYVWVDHMVVPFWHLHLPEASLLLLL